MNKYTTEKMTALIGMLKHTNLLKEQIIVLSASIPTEKCSDEIAEMLIRNKENLKEIPQQSMMNMCGEIIEHYL